MHGLNYRELKKPSASLRRDSKVSEKEEASDTESESNEDVHVSNDSHKLQTLSYVARLLNLTN